MRLTIKGLMEISEKESRTRQEATTAYRRILHFAGSYRGDMAAVVADRFLRTFGVEEFETKKGRYLYANTGESYAPTVMVPIGGWRTLPFISTYGDVVAKEG